LKIRILELSMESNKITPAIVFMGTPVFAAEILKAMIESGYNIVAVVTAPDKPAGRGQKLSSPPVKEYALSKGIKVLQPLKLKDPDFIQELINLQADLFTVVAFRMLPETVWKIPRLGTFNLHASLLPDYRGAAPINHAIINGETKTGLTTFFINHEIDSGSILLREEIDIFYNDTAGKLHDRMIATGAKLVVETIERIISETATPLPQSSFYDNKEFKTAPKIFKNDCRIQWDNPSVVIYNFIRGLSPFPGAWTEITDKSGKTLHMKVYMAEELARPHKLSPGTLETDGKEHLLVASNDGFISIKNLQLEGKKRLDTPSFLRGFTDIENYRFI